MLNALLPFCGYDSRWFDCLCVLLLVCSYQCFAHSPIYLCFAGRFIPKDAHTHTKRVSSWTNDHRYGFEFGMPSDSIYGWNRPPLRRLPLTDKAHIQAFNSIICTMYDVRRPHNEQPDIEMVNIWPHLFIITNRKVLCLLCDVCSCETTKKNRIGHPFKVKMRLII